MSRTTVVLSLLSAAIIALALLADAREFGSRTTTLAMVLLPVVLFLGIATHIRLVQINSEEVRTVLAMNRLRNAYLELEPGIEPYLSTGHYDDEKGLAASYLITGSDRLRPWAQFLQATATIVATVDAALVATIVVLALQAADAPTRRCRSGGNGQLPHSVGRAVLISTPCFGSAPPYGAAISIAIGWTQIGVPHFAESWCLSRS